VLTYDDIPRTFNLADHFLGRHVEEGRGERTALICEDERISYAQLGARTNRVGNVLRDLGVRREERVLMVVDDGVEFVASWYAIIKVGAVTAEVYTFLAAKDLAYYLDYTRAGIAIVSASALDRFREAAAQSRHLRATLVVGAAPGTLQAGEHGFEELVAAAPETCETEPTSRDDIAIWKFTTGSTGAPKGCVHLMHSPLLSSECYARSVLDIGPDDVVLPVPKLFFGYARDLTALYPFAAGGAGIVFPQRTTAERIFELIARHRPTILVNVPTMMRAMVEHETAAEQDLSCLRACTSAGEGLPRELHERWTERFGVEILDGIGSSEAYHIYISARPGRSRAGTVGEIVPGYEARIVGPDGADLPDGETGRLWVRGPTAAIMYFGDRAKSVQTFAGDVVMTGDLFSRDADGMFAYRGRADDLLKVGGIWVAPAEIEACLLEHPAVADVAVVSYHEDGLQRPRAFVVAAPAASPGDELAAALKAHVRSTLSPHKYPRDLRFIDDLPKTGSGKVDRQALREAEV
jgi:benzoate-CoA ligase family protein